MNVYLCLRDDMNVDLCTYCMNYSSSDQSAFFHCAGEQRRGDVYRAGTVCAMLSYLSLVLINGTVLS